MFLVAALVAAASAELFYVDLTGANDASHNEAPTIIVHTGDLIKVTFKENPTTGYTWQFADPIESTQGVFTIEMDDYSQNANPEEAYAGAGGIRSVVLKAEKAGTQGLEAILVRSWEANQFVESTDLDGQHVDIKSIPHVDYKNLIVTVSE